jgi:predicted RecB family nuclease
MTIRLSKSKYMAGLQCPKRLYLEIHARELAGETDPATQAVLDAGTRVGELARGWVPGGVLVDVEHSKIPEGLARTATLLQDRSLPALYEGFLQCDGVLVRPDLLVRTGRTRWRLIEVKSSTRAKPEHADDLAIQTYVLRGAGLAVESAQLLHLNAAYCYPGGPHDVARLFRAEDLTAEVEARQEEIPERLAAMRQVLATPAPPAVAPDGHCATPYECPFWNHCTQDKPPRWIYHLAGSARTVRELMARGIETIDDIPAEYPLQLLQRRMRDNVEWIGPGLSAALATVTTPVHHLDFETVGSALPLYPGTHPYEAVPFQWSNHIEAADGTLSHEAYLCPDSRDPRPELAEALLASLGDVGSICTYTRYERGVITRLADDLPHLRTRLLHLCDRLWDLHPVIKAHYYHPGFAGSYSLKAVLPAVVPALAYGDLEIQDGTLASVAFARMAFGGVDAAEQARIRTALLAYCARDTLAMVELRRALRAKAEKKRQ